MIPKQLVVDQVTVAGSQGRKRLESVSCVIETGKLTLLIGSVGSGKSTLLDVLGGLVIPNSGSVKEVNGEGTAAPCGLGMMFQFPEQQLFARTVQGEFDYSLRPLKLPQPQAAAQTASALRETGLAGGTLALHPFSLSGGEQRRVAMATTLAAAPGWLLLDEASAGLDAEGLRRFAQQLRRWTRQDGVGIVLVTHDLETFLPLADEVLVLVRGRLAAAMSREQLLAAPAVLRQAGLALPERMRAAEWLRARGLAAPAATPAAGEGAGDALSPAAFAEAVSRALAAPAAAPTPPLALAPVAAPAAAPTPPLAPAPAAPAPAAAAAPTPPLAPAAVPTPPLAASAARQPVDPRATWLTITIVSIGMLLQNSWTGLAISEAIAILMIATSTVPYRALGRAVLPFAGLTAFTVVFSGIRLDGFAFPQALLSLRSMLRFLFILAVGFLLPLQYSPLTIKRTLERSLASLTRWRLPVDVLALYVAMLMRFIPLIRTEWARFSRIARARGRSGSKPGTVRLRDLPAIAIPMLVSLLRLADAAAVTLEMRGYHTIGTAASKAIPAANKLSRTDYTYIALGFGAFLLLLFVRIME